MTSYFDLQAVHLAGDIADQLGLDLPKLVEIIIGETFCAVKNYLESKVDERTISNESSSDTIKPLPESDSRDSDTSESQSDIIAVTQGVTLGDPNAAWVRSSESGLTLEWRHHLFKCVDSAPLIMKKKGDPSGYVSRLQCSDTVVLNFSNCL